jgi:hypothetical protein
LEALLQRLEAENLQRPAAHLKVVARAEGIGMLGGHVIGCYPMGRCPRRWDRRAERSPAARVRRGERLRESWTLRTTMMEERRSHGAVDTTRIVVAAAAEPGRTGVFTRSSRAPCKARRTFRI